MLVLPDSGYNSPCHGIFPSSFAILPSKLEPVNSKICRKLKFGTRLCSNTGHDITSTHCKFRSKEIASRLLLMCDLFDNEFAQFSEQGMLVLPDSGYNSPCDGVYPSSFAFSSPSKLRPKTNLKICRKLDFETHLCPDTGYYVTSTDCSCRPREIANRLMLMYDLFDNEFAEFPQQGISWTASILRLFGY